MNVLLLFGIVLFAMLTIIGLMSVGVIFSNKPIKGSCGGLNAVGIDGECKVCGKKPSPDCRLESDDAPVQKNKHIPYDAMKDRDL